MSTSIRPAITWVNDKPSSTGKTIRVLLTHPDFPQDIAHFANIPTYLSPEKWNVVEADTVKLGDIETDYFDEVKGVRVELKVPQRQVSFFGTVGLCDPEIPETKWVDKRTRKAAPVASNEASF